MEEIISTEAPVTFCQATRSPNPERINVELSGNLTLFVKEVILYAYVERAELLHDNYF